METPRTWRTETRFHEDSGRWLWVFDGPSPQGENDVPTLIELEPVLDLLEANMLEVFTREALRDGDGLTAQEQEVRAFLQAHGRLPNPGESA